MKLGRKRTSMGLLRAAPAAALAVVAMTSLAEGCSSDKGNDTAAGPTTTSANGGSTSTSTSNGGGGNGGMGGGGTVTPGVSVVAEGNTPFDATPDPDAKNVFFTGNDPVKGSGVFRVAYSGGTVTTVAAGDPFVAPFGIATSSDGKKLFVADPGADTDGKDKGAILALDPTEGLPAAVMGTAGYQPRNLEVFKGTEGDIIYFSGTDPTGKAGVFLVPAAGGTVTTVLTAPLVEPSGIAIDSKGTTLFVADTVAPSRTQTIIYKTPLMSPAATAVVSNVPTGYPAGIALRKNDLTLYVSGFDPANGNEAIIEVNLTENSQTIWKGDAKTDVSQNLEPAGMHRAKNVDALAFVDSIAGAKRGTVYVFAK